MKIIKPALKNPNSWFVYVKVCGYLSPQYGPLWRVAANVLNNAVADSRQGAVFQLRGWAMFLLRDHFTEPNLYYYYYNGFSRSGMRGVIS